MPAAQTRAFEPRDDPMPAARPRAFEPRDDPTPAARPRAFDPRAEPRASRSDGLLEPRDHRMQLGPDRSRSRASSVIGVRCARARTRARSSRSRSSTSRRVLEAVATRLWSWSRAGEVGAACELDRAPARTVVVSGQVGQRRAGAPAQVGRAARRSDSAVSSWSLSMRASTRSPRSGSAMHSDRNPARARGARSAGGADSRPPPDRGRCRSGSGRRRTARPPTAAREPPLGQLQPPRHPAHEIVSQDARPGALEHRRELLQRALSPLGAAGVGGGEDPLDREHHERHRPLDRGPALPRRPRARPGRRGRWPRAAAPPAAPGCARRPAPRPAPSLLAGPVGVEAQLQHPHHALELVDLLLGQRGAHDARRRCAAPPGATPARRCSPRPGSSGPACAAGRRARSMPNRTSRLWYSSPSEVFRYLAPPWFSRIRRAPKPRRGRGGQRPGT